MQPDEEGEESITVSMLLKSKIIRCLCLKSSKEDFTEDLHARRGEHGRRWD